MLRGYLRSQPLKVSSEPTGLRHGQSECSVAAFWKSTHDLGVRDTHVALPKKQGCTNLATHLWGSVQ